MHAGNMADLPWEVVHSTVISVSGVGVAHLTLLQALHARLQAARKARSSKSGSRSNLRASSKAGSRSGVSGQSAGSVRPHVSQSVAFGSQQQQAAAGLATAGLGLQFATADASAGAAFAGAAAEVLDPFAVTVKQPGASPWMMRFPSQPTGAGTAAEPVWLGGECGLRGCGKPRWMRPDGSMSEACCLDHVRLMAMATREVRGGGLDSPSVVSPAGGPPPPAQAETQPVGQQDGPPVSPVAYQGSADQHVPPCAIEECVRPRYVTRDGIMLNCCGVTHGRELLVRQQALVAVPGSAQPPQQLARMVGRTPGPTYVQDEVADQRQGEQGGQGEQRTQVQQQQPGQGQPAQWPPQQQGQLRQSPAGAQFQSFVGRRCSSGSLRSSLR